MRLLLENEIVDALKQLKNHKSLGVDGITNEQLKYGQDGLVDQLVVLFKKVWEDEKIPEDWSLSSLERRVTPLIVLITEALH